MPEVGVVAREGGDPRREPERREPPRERKQAEDDERGDRPADERGASPDRERADQHHRHELDVDGGGEREGGASVPSALRLEHRETREPCHQQVHLPLGEVVVDRDDDRHERQRERRAPRVGVVRRQPGERRGGARKRERGDDLERHPAGVSPDRRQHRERCEPRRERRRIEVRLVQGRDGVERVESLSCPRLTPACQ